MAASGLKLFLGALIDNINSLPDNHVLREESNLEPHTFKFTPTQLYNTIVKAQKPYKSSGWILSSDDKKHMKELCFKHGEVLTKEIKKLGGTGLGKGGVTFTFTTSTDVGPEKLSPRMESLKEKGHRIPQPDDVFQKIKTSYYDSMQALFQELQTYFGQQAPLNARGKKRGFRDRAGKGAIAKEHGSVIEAGHEHGGGIAETSLKSCWDLAFEMHKQALQESGIKSAKALKTRLKRLGFDLSVVRDDDGEGFVIRLEDRAGNKAEGIVVKNLKKEFQEQCKKTIEKIDVGKITSSDSIIERNRKLIVNELTKEFKKIKRVKVKTENIQISKKKSKEQTQQIGKVKASKTSALDLSGSLSIKAGRRRQKRKPAPPKMALENILGVLNNQLPKVVAANMGNPRLENRTGRFAQSVRATDVTKTPQGFASIGYTYMKERYGGYESTSGSRFADVDRDPRPLIDQSIREIVIGFGLGRVFTRRQ